MRKIPVIPSISIIAGLLIALIPQAIHAGWARTWGEGDEDVGYCVEKTDDDAYLIAAEKNGDIWLLKVNGEGDSLWGNVQVEEGNDAPHEIHHTSDGNFIITGDKSTSLWLEKIDPEGVEIWDKRYGGKGGIGYSVVETPDEGFLVTGQFGYGSLWLVKTDANGDTAWSRTYDEWGYDYGTHVIQTSDGGYVITGACHGSAIINSEPLYDVWVIRLDQNFDTLWTSSFGNDMINERGRAIAETDNGFLVCADRTSGWSDLWLLRLDNNGDTLWTKKFGMRYSTEIGYSMQPTSDGNYIITGKIDGGTTVYDLWLLKVDADGNELFSKTYVGDFDDCGYWAEETDDGGFIITGYTETSEDDADVWLIKTDAKGDTLSTCIIEQPYRKLPTSWSILSPVAQRITLSYTDMPQGFHAQVFDATGSKVDELHAPLTSGTISWGRGFGPGVYFIRVNGISNRSAARVVLLK